MATEAIDDGDGALVYPPTPEGRRARNAARDSRAAARRELAVRRAQNGRDQREFNDYDDCVIMAWRGPRFKHGHNPLEHVACVNIQKGGVARASLSARVPGAAPGDPYRLEWNQEQLGVRGHNRASRVA